MRKASLTQERRERLIAALPDEHFAINDVKRVFGQTISSTAHHTNTFSLMDTHAGSLSPYQRREQTSYPRRYRSTLATGHVWADADSVDDETEVNSADLQVFVRSELEAQPSWN